MLVVAHLQPRARARLARGPRPVAWVAGIAGAIAQGAVACSRPRLAALVAVHSVAAWLAIGLGTWLGVRAVGADVAFGAVLVILPMLALGVALPTPGGAGGYHGAMKFGLVAFGVAEPVAVGAGLVLHVLITVPILVVGLVLLWTEGISWRDLRASARAMLQSGAGGVAPHVVESRT
jgi:hypothetical protein